MNYTLYQLLWFYLLYSFIGWAIGTSVAAVREHRFIDVGFFIRPLLSGLWFRGSGICCLSARTQKSPVFSFSGRGDSFICYHVFYRFCSGENIPSEMVGLLTEKISIWRLCQPSIHSCVGNLCRSLYLLYQPIPEGTARLDSLQPGNHIVNCPVRGSLSRSGRNDYGYQSRSFQAAKTLYH